MAARLLSTFLILSATSSLITHSLASNFLYSGQVLYGGQEINEGSCGLAMQNDCNLVLYNSGVPIWASGTSGAGQSCFLTLQNDGGLVIYSGNKDLWSSNTQRAPVSKYVLVIQRDCNVVLYGPELWSTRTNRLGTANAPSSLLTDSLASNFLSSGEYLYGGQEINEGSCGLAMQTDCNLVLYNSGVAIWASGTYRAEQNCYLYVGYDGNLGVYSGKNSLWSSNTQQPRENKYIAMVMPQDCKVVLYGGEIWSTKTNRVSGDKISKVTDTEK